MIFGAQQLGNQPMDHIVVGGGIVAHQVHRGPIFLAGLAVQIQPGQPAESSHISLATGARDGAVGRTDRGPRAATAAMAEQGNVFAGLQAQLGVGRGQGQQSELDEVVARPRRAELPPGFVLVFARHPA